MSSANYLVSQLTLAAQPNAAAWARRHTDDVLNHWHVPSASFETARLIVSELAGHAMHHADGGTFTIRLNLAGPRLVIQVSDGDPVSPALRATRGEADGSGLHLVDALSHQWGHYRPRGIRGKIFWAELRLDAPTWSDPAGSASQPDLHLIGRILTGLHEI